MSSKLNTKKRQEIESLIQHILTDPKMQANEPLIKMLKGLREDLKSNEYRITIIGEFSSGKSTFINALLGKDILPHGVEETTAAVTYIHNVSKNSSKVNKVEIIFNDPSSPVKILNLSSSPTALIDYVTAKSTNKDVVKEIAEVHIYVPFMSGNDQLVLIDTPGLNGVKEGLRDITYREIHRSHANVCLFHIKGASQSDLDFIEKFYKKGTPFFFVLNQIDALNEETPEERIEKFSCDVMEHIIHTNKKPSNVFGISALKALTARDHNIRRLYSDDKADLADVERAKLLESSRMEQFERSLYDFVSNGEIEYNFLENIKGRLTDILTSARQNTEREIEILKIKTINLPEKAVLERQGKVVEKSIEGNKKIIKNKLSARMAELERSTNCSVREHCESISEAAEKIVSQWTDLDKAEKDAKAGKVVNLINDKVNYLRTAVIKPDLHEYFNKIYSELIDTIQTFSPSIEYSKKSALWNVVIGQEKCVDMSKLDEINKKIKSLENNRATETAEKRRVQSELDDLRRQRSNIEDSIRNVHQSRQYDLNRLGSRPMYQEWEVEVPTTKRVLFFFTRNSTKTEYYDNRDEIKRYDERYKSINRTYDDKLNTLYRAKENIVRNMDYKSNQMSNKELLLKRIESELVALKHRQQQENEEVEFLRKNARKELLKQLKENAQALIKGAITPESGELYLALRDETQNNISNVEKIMSEQLEKLYLDYIKEFKKKLAEMIDKIEKKADVAGINRTIALLNEQLKQLLYYLSILNRIQFS